MEEVVNLFADGLGKTTFLADSEYYVIIVTTPLVIMALVHINQMSEFRTCKHHGLTEFQSSYLFRNGKKRPHHQCKTCQSNWRQKNKSKLNKRSLNQFITKYHNSLDFRKQRSLLNKQYRLNLKSEILNHYGGSQPRCACCAEDSIKFLCIDHVDGGGRKHFKMIGGSGRFYRWLEDNDYPSGYRILCFNCNASISTYGYCPHQAS